MPNQITLNTNLKFAGLLGWIPDWQHCSTNVSVIKTQVTVVGDWQKHESDGTLGIPTIL